MEMRKIISILLQDLNIFFLVKVNNFVLNTLLSLKFARVYNSRMLNFAHQKLRYSRIFKFAHVRKDKNKDFFLFEAYKYFEVVK